MALTNAQKAAVLDALYGGKPLNVPTSCISVFPTSQS